MKYLEKSIIINEKSAGLLPSLPSLIPSLAGLLPSLPQSASSQPPLPQRPPQLLPASSPASPSLRSPAYQYPKA